MVYQPTWGGPFCTILFLLYIYIYIHISIHIYINISRYLSIYIYSLHIQGFCSMTSPYHDISSPHQPPWTAEPRLLQWKIHRTAAIPRVRYDHLTVSRDATCHGDWHHDWMIWLVGQGLPVLKNDGVRQLGWWQKPNIHGKMQPNNINGSQYWKFCQILLAIFPLILGTNHWKCQIDGNQTTNQWWLMVEIPSDADDLELGSWNWLRIPKKKKPAFSIL